MFFGAVLYSIFSNLITTALPPDYKKNTRGKVRNLGILQNPTESEEIEWNPRESNRIQQNPLDSLSFHGIPGFRAFSLENLNESKGIQENPKESQEILGNLNEILRNLKGILGNSKKS